MTAPDITETAAVNDKVYNVLFISTRNSARSIMAEGILNSLGALRFRASSAGGQSSGTVHALALTTLAKMGMPTHGYRSKAWTEFDYPAAPSFDFVFAVFDEAAGEVCPVWPGHRTTAHWAVADPAAVEGTDAQKSKAFSDAAVVLKHRIELMLALPLESLDRLALTCQGKDVGTR